MQSAHDSVYARSIGLLLLPTANLLIPQQQQQLCPRLTVWAAKTLGGQQPHAACWSVRPDGHLSTSSVGWSRGQGPCTAAAAVQDLPVGPPLRRTTVSTGIPGELLVHSGRAVVTPIYAWLLDGALHPLLLLCCCLFVQRLDASKT